MANIDWFQTKKPEALILTIQAKVGNSYEISNQFSSPYLLEDLKVVKELNVYINYRAA